MKALTICQPFATMIARGMKRVENRTWPAPDSAIGQRFAIHAGKSKDWLCEDNYGIPLSELPFGSIVATATLAECIRWADAFERDAKIERRLQEIGFPLDEFMEHEHTEGPVCWVFTDVKPLAVPVPYKGAQGIWFLPDTAINGF